MFIASEIRLPHWMLFRRLCEYGGLKIQKFQHILWLRKFTFGVKVLNLRKFCSCWRKCHFLLLLHFYRFSNRKVLNGSFFVFCICFGVLIWVFDADPTRTFFRKRGPRIRTFILPIFGKFLSKSYGRAFVWIAHEWEDYFMGKAFVRNLFAFPSRSPDIFLEIIWNLLAVNSNFLKNRLKIIEICSHSRRVWYTNNSTVHLTITTSLSFWIETVSLWWTYSIFKTSIWNFGLKRVSQHTS